jgi:hypothetical protein
MYDRDGQTRLAVEIGGELCMIANTIDSSGKFAFDCYPIHSASQRASKRVAPTSAAAALAAGLPERYVDFMRRSGFFKHAE